MLGFEVLGQITLAGKNCDMESASESLQVGMNVFVGMRSQSTHPFHIQGIYKESSYVGRGWRRARWADGRCRLTQQRFQVPQKLSPLLSYN